MLEICGTNVERGYEKDEKERRQLDQPQQFNLKKQQTGDWVAHTLTYTNRGDRCVAKLLVGKLIQKRSFAYTTITDS